jgi:hypothetical protein
MAKEPHPVVVAGVSLLGGAVLLWLTRTFLFDDWLLGLVVAGGVTGAMLVASGSNKSGGYLIRGMAGILVVAGFVRSVWHAGGRLEGGFTVMGGILLGISVTQFLMRRFDHPWMAPRNAGPK